MKYLSVCSGIEAATVAWHPLGWEPVGFSEIEKFPSSVLKHHYDVPNYGDMNDHENWPEIKPDVLVGGTPCQSFSVAGLRAGMADPRGNLALVYLAIADQYRPRWLVWENVPGVLSINEGRDFGAIIGAMVKLGYSPCWRVLDAQYYGVAQRRSRVFVVSSLGDWTDSAKVLFEPSCLRRHPAPSRQTGQDVTGTPASRSSAGGGLGTGLELDGGLLPDIVGAFYSVHGTQDPIVSDKAHPLQAKNGDRVNAIAFAQNQRDEVGLMDKAGALAAEPGAKQQTYIFKPGQGSKARSDGLSEHVAPTLSSDSGGNSVPAVAHGIPGNWIGRMAVRRLTPLECERLQGFPDGYTDIPGASDSGRYKALGNSMAVPVMNWIGKRINEAL